MFGVAYQVLGRCADTIDLTEGVLIGNYERRAVQPSRPLAGDAAPADAFTLRLAPPR